MHFTTKAPSAQRFYGYLEVLFKTSVTLRDPCGSVVKILDNRGVILKPN
jgi:hypothetical protein